MRWGGEVALSKNMLAGLFVLLAAGFATWLFLPLTTASVEPATTPPPVIVPIGPIQVDLMLVVLFIAGGAPFAGLMMGLLVRWLGGKVPPGAATPAPRLVQKQAPDALASVSSEEAELPLLQKLGLWLLILIMLGVIGFLVLQVLPPGFTLF